MNFKFENVESDKKPNSNLHSCSKCDLIFEANDIEGMECVCMANDSNVQLKKIKVTEKNVESDLINYYKERNCYLEFEQKTGESTEDATVRFVHEFLHRFRY